MMHRAALAKLKQDVADLKRHTPSARLFVYNPYDYSRDESYVSGQGHGPVQSIHVPHEFETAREWLNYCNREV